MSKARDLADFISTGSILSDGTIESTEISGVTADATEINKLDGLTADTTELNKLDGVTATTAELNKLAGTTATTSDFDKLSNVTASATELNYMTGATSSIQTQLDNISVTSGSLTKSFASGESATITLAQSITPAPVVSVTKEVSQTGQSSKGAWDVNATASNYDLHNTAYATTLQKSNITSGTAYGTTAATGGTSSTFTAATFNDIRGINFSTDGTKMVALNQNSVTLRDYTLSTAWDVSTATYNGTQGQLGASFSGNGIGMDWKPDGYKVWIPDFGNGNIREFTANTPFNASSLGSIQSFNFGNSDFLDIKWKPDGTKVYFCTYSAGSVHQFTCSTPWSLGTASNEVTYNVPAQSQFLSIDASHDGTALYIGTHNPSFHIVKVSMSTAWDLSTASDSIHLVTQSGHNNFGIIKYEDEGRRYYWNDYGSNVINYVETVASSTGLVLGTGSFASTDVGKRIQGNGGDVILTSTAGAYDTTGGSDFTDSSTIASGSWTMHGLKSAGAVSGLTLAGKLDIYNLGSAAFDSSKSGELMTSGTQSGLAFNADGTYAYTCQGTLVYGFTLSTAYDISTAAQDVSYTVNLSAQATGLNSITWNNDGTKFFVTNQVDPNGNVLEYSTASNPYQPQYASYTRSLGVTGRPRQLIFSPDGTKLFVASYDDYINEFTLTTGFDLSTATLVSNVNPFTTNPSFQAIQFNEDGSELYLGSRGDAYVIKIPLTTSYSLAGYTTNSIVYADQTVLLDVSATHAGNLHHMLFADNGTKFYIVGASSTNRQIRYYTSGSGITIPTGSYNLAVTKPAGQIDSAYWTDINSMTADQSLGDGEAYYAVSTDDRTTWSVAKASDGVRPIVRDNAGTWQYNSQETINGYLLAAASYDNNTKNTGASNLYGIYLKDDGTKLYAAIYPGTIRSYPMTTAYDLSTLSTVAYDDFSLSVGANNGTDLFISSDGVYLFHTAIGPNVVRRYTMTTPWDITTAGSQSGAAIDSSTSGLAGSLQGIDFKPDGTKMYVCDNSQVGQWNLSTAWSAGSGTNGSLPDYKISLSSYLSGSVQAIRFKDDGTEFYAVDSTNGDVLIYTMSTAWDLSTATYSSKYANTQTLTTARGLAFGDSGTKMFVSDETDQDIFRFSTGGATYSTSTTWTNATTNDEFYALQQALGATSVNRMNKTQLDAVADGSHFTLGNTLDLMIALKQDTASASLPTSDGVTINYDAQALNQGAVLGTDYDFDFPANNKVRITSNAAQNLKIRVV